ncbi:MAG: polyphosphate kinase [Alphaproteobacteria bacterium]|nr:polyphosphate kinase [Alphaproteobacteria bacterium]
MNKKSIESKADQESRNIGKPEYQAELHGLQIELVKLQKHFIRCNDRILVLIEGRDAAGKDGVIKRIIKHLSPRETRVVALESPRIVIAAAGIFSALFRTFPQNRSSSCSTAAGTTAPGSNG